MRFLTREPKVLGSRLHGFMGFDHVLSLMMLFMCRGSCSRQMPWRRKASVPEWYVENEICNSFSVRPFLFALLESVLFSGA